MHVTKLDLRMTLKPGHISGNRLLDQRRVLRVEERVDHGQGYHGVPMVRAGGAMRVKAEYEAAWSGLVVLRR